ncbi:MAG: hypothetical protein J5634_01830 [Bacilli bacterium]|nr:hypothetical protein [Bacilli bacterium]
MNNENKKLLYSLYDDIDYRKFRSLKDAWRIGFQTYGYLQVYADDLETLYAVHISNYFQGKVNNNIPVNFQSYDTPIIRHTQVFEGSTFQQILDGFERKDDEFQEFVEIQYQVGDFRKSFMGDIPYNQVNICIFSINTVYLDGDDIRCMTRIPYDVNEYALSEAINKINEGYPLNSYFNSSTVKVRTRGMGKETYVEDIIAS